MKRILTLLLSAFLSVFAFVAAGCIVEDKAPNGSFGIEQDGSDVEGSSSSDGTSTGEESQKQAFTVRLRTADGGTMGSLEGVQAIWTDLNGVNIYQAEFNKEGVATCYGPDGEYQITLSNTPQGYAYNPNVYFADNNKSEVVIALYPVREFRGSSTGQKPPDQYSVTNTGVYRFTFESPSDEFYFNFGAVYSGRMSFQSLLDVTANEVLPIFYTAGTIYYFDVQIPVIGGGAENTYTKNFLYEFQLTNSQDKLFKIGVETVNIKAFPVTIDVLIQKEGEYTDNDIQYEVVPTPELWLPDSLREDTENGGWLAAKPTSGRFTYIYNTNKGVLDETMVIEHEGYYYVKDAEGKADLTKPLYAMLTKDIPSFMEAEGAGLSYSMVRHKCASSKKDYTNFINAYFVKVNKDGVYPVDTALKEYLFDFCKSKQLVFDGMSTAEQEGYKTDGASRWLFACGYYR